MGKLTVLVFSSVLFFIFTVSAFAQTATTPSTLRQELKGGINQKKEEIQTLKDQFKARLQTIKDVKKQLLVDRLSTKLNEVNAKHTAKFLEVLSKLQASLDRINLSVTDSKVIEKIKSAQTAIDLAKKAVEAQAEKTYIIQITSEKSLRANVGTTVSLLRRELMQTHKLVINAKQAVMKLIPEKISIRKEATVSAK